MRIRAARMKQRDVLCDKGKFEMRHKRLAMALHLRPYKQEGWSQGGDERPEASDMRRLPNHHQRRTISGVSGPAKR